MEPQPLIDVTLGDPDHVVSRRILAEQIPFMSLAEQDQLVEALKTQADELMRTDIQCCLQICDLMQELATTTANPLHQALERLARANAYAIGLGEFQQGIDLYDQAAAIYAAEGLVVKQAESHIGKLYALANLGHYDQALADGEWAWQALSEHGEWLKLARLEVNLAIIYGRLGQDSKALAMFDLAREAYQRLSAEGELYWSRVELNRAVVLRNLGCFDESIRASQSALEILGRSGQRVAIARAQQNLAMTYLVMGRYNEALALLDEARQVFQRDGRPRHALLVELFVSDCLLQLRRFRDVLEKCQRMRTLFGELGNRFEVAQTLLNEASANMGLGHYADALNSLGQARQLFEQEGNPVAVANTDLQAAAAWLKQTQPEEALVLAETCVVVYQAHNLPVCQAQAYLVAARSALALNRWEASHYFAAQALKLGREHNLPALTYPSHYLLAQLAVQQGQASEGLTAYEQAILDLERLCGHLMIEFRADFIEDKEQIYQDAVALCLKLNLAPRGLEYAERAKSRSLLDLVAHRLSLSITARNEADQPLVTELTRLLDERDHLYRRWQSREGLKQLEASDPSFDPHEATPQRLLALEKQVTDLWHTLLIRNADYARDAALWRVRTEPIQPFLDADTLLLEYFIVHDKLIVFLVSKDDIQTVRLPASLEQVQRLVQMVWLNLRSVQHSPQGHIPALTTNIQGVLSKLYKILIAPLETHLAPYRHLTIVPHGPLHYLPMHALYDGQTYLLETHQVSYLPGASLLRYCRESRSGAGSLVAMGHSYQGHLPYAVQEAQAIAQLWQGQEILEDQATLAQFRNTAPGCRLLHLATHGDFRPDNPLFSGLALADGWLTTLEIFNLRLNASLVTLSACQTGRSVVGGGDELLGLMRSFLAAGAAALVVSLWAVDDCSTSQLMQTMYQNLLEGQSKSDALRQAQLGLLNQDMDKYHHPYFWAPFFLVGDSGRL